MKKKKFLLLITTKKKNLNKTKNNKENLKKEEKPSSHSKIVIKNLELNKNNCNNKNVNHSTKISQSKKDPVLNKKDLSKNFKRNAKITGNFDEAKKLKRGISTDTYNYYSKKQNKNMDIKNNTNNNNNNNKREKPKSASNKTTNLINKVNQKTYSYIPRLYNEKVIKKWETINNKKWYSLSPNSRAKANEEMAKIAKQN
jgi:hypothetical protein